MDKKLTHKGWFGFCPVYFADINSDAPIVVERHFLLTPIMILSEFTFSIGFFLMGLTNQDFEPAWPLKITGELKDNK